MVLDLLLDEREIFQLSASTGIVLDMDRLYALSKRELLVNLADVFLGIVGTTKPELRNTETSVNTLVSQFLTEKAQAAISRVGYMEISEIETFFKTSDVLIEGGDFGEIVWALLIDQRTAVVEHGYKLLNTTYESIEVAYTNGSGDFHSIDQSETIDSQYAYDTENEPQQSGRSCPKNRAPLNNNWQTLKQTIPRLSKNIAD